MPAKRRYNVKGTNDFLVLAGIFFFLGLWAVKDAWYPSDKVLKKHPLEVNIAFEVHGSVDKVRVEEGDSISENEVLATLRSDRMKVAYEEAKDKHAEARKAYLSAELAYRNAQDNNSAAEVVAGLKKSMDDAQTIMDDAEALVVETHDAIGLADLKAPSKGKVKEILIHSHKLVQPGETAIIIDPTDHFYLFNKSLAIFSFFAFWIFLAIHILAR